MKRMNVKGIYYVECNNEYSFEEALEIICCEESIGIESITFSDRLRIYPGITDLSKEIISKYKATYEIKERLSENEGIVEIVFPVDNILQKGSIINSIFSTLMGDLFGIDVIENIRLLDIKFPEEVLAIFPGPKYGLEGIQSLLGKPAPYVGVISKPNLGLNPKELGEMVYKLCIQGAEFIKDDELMMNPETCLFSERTKYVKDAIERAKAITKRNTLYAINISGDGRNTLDNAYTAVINGANCLMVNVLTTGFDVLAEIAACKEINVPIHTHRCMHDIFTSNSKFGVSPKVLGMLVRLCGADFYHIGIFAGKTKKKIDEMLQVYNVLTNNEINMASTIPIVSRSSILSIGMTRTYIPKLDILFLMCGSYYRSKYKNMVIGGFKDEIQEILYGKKAEISYDNLKNELLELERETYYGG